MSFPFCMASAISVSNIPSGRSALCELVQCWRARAPPLPESLLRCQAALTTGKLFLKEPGPAFLSFLGPGANTEHPLPRSIPSHSAGQFLETAHQKPSFWMPSQVSSNVLSVSHTLKCL